MQKKKKKKKINLEILIRNKIVFHYSIYALLFEKFLFISNKNIQGPDRKKFT